MARNKVWWRIQGDPNARSYKENWGKFWRWTDANAAKIWKEISDALDGTPTNSRAMTRWLITKKLANLLRSWVVDFGDFFSWIGVSDTEEAKRILDDMDKWKMPPCHESQRTWDKYAHETKTHLHHDKPINRWWPVHALRNILFLSPKKHKTVLNPKVHYWEHYWEKEERRRDAQEARKRAQIKKKK